jgi:peptidoglycan hydrolase-like protein with peptidoglycan-binding domain
MNETKLKKLWDKIDAKIKSKVLKPLQGIKTWEDFKSVMAKQSNRKKFWDAVHVDYASKGVFLGEWEDFEEVYGGDDNPLKKYEGVYEQSTVKLDVKVKAEGDKLIASMAGYDFTFSNNGVNTFINDSGNVEIIFTQDGSGNITGGKLTTTSLTVKTFLKGNDSLSFVKKSDVIPTTTSTTTLTKPPSPWDCIINFNKELNQFNLIDEGDYRYEQVEGAVNGQETIFMYYKDGNAVWAYLRDKKPILKGKWECKGDKGYLIKWSDGQISRYGTKENNLGGQTDVNTNTTTNALENPCVNGYKEGCVTENDILGKKKALKVCSKCDLIKTVQENPEIRARIFRIQKELGQEQKTDNTFGPVMLAAIKEFQQSHGINPTGNVGELTLSKINPLLAKNFYISRGGKKFGAGDKKGGAADYQKALQILDDGDERDATLYFVLGATLKDKKAACSALIKSMERGEVDSADYYDSRKCSEISGFPSRADFYKSYKTKVSSGVSTTAVEKPKTDGTNNLKSDEQKSNKAEVKPIYRRSSRQVLSPDDEL